MRGGRPLQPFRSPAYAGKMSGGWYRRRLLLLWLAILTAMLVLAVCLGLGLAVLLG